ncbi:caspase recruitment domain-containing protein 19-like isoform X2 [Eucyclogobius newberryi]
MDTELLDELVLQLNRTYPQILSDKEAHKFRNVRVLTKLRFAELLRNLHCKGEEACLEFYRGLQLHAEDLYCRLPSRGRYRDMEETKRINGEMVTPGPSVLNDKGPMFFLSCFSLVVGVAILYYCGEKESLNHTSPWLHCSARKLSKGAKHILLSYAEAGKHNV